MKKGSRGGGGGECAAGGEGGGSPVQAVELLSAHVSFTIFVATADCVINEDSTERNKLQALTKRTPCTRLPLSQVV